MEEGSWSGTHKKRRKFVDVNVYLLAWSGHGISWSTPSANHRLPWIPNGNESEPAAANICAAFKENIIIESSFALCTSASEQEILLSRTRFGVSHCFRITRFNSLPFGDSTPLVASERGVTSRRNQKCSTRAKPLEDGIAKSWREVTSHAACSSNLVPSDYHLLSVFKNRPHANYVLQW